jgi:hypothetical protein
MCLCMRLAVVPLSKYEHMDTKQEQAQHNATCSNNRACTCLMMVVIKPDHDTVLDCMLCVVLNVRSLGPSDGSLPFQMEEQIIYSFCAQDSEL